MSREKNVKRWLEKLNAEGCQSKNTAFICETLMKLRPFSKKSPDIKKILNNGGAEVLLKYLQGLNRRILDMSISILANCLTESAFQQKVFECQGIPHIVRVLQCVKNFSILSRTCRSISNLATHHESAKVLHSVGTVELIVELIRNTSATTDCTLSALRALKNLGNSPSHRKKLVQQGVVSAIARLIPFETKDIATASVRALSAISRSCTIEFADHMLSNDGIAISELVKIARDTADYGYIVKEHALVVLQNLTLQACTRPTLGSFKGIDLFVMEVQNIIGHICNAGIHPQFEGPLPHNAFSLVSSLCYCCREAINRARLRSLNALPIFVCILKDPRWQPIQLFMLGSLQCFVYDEEGLKILHENGIFGVLLQKLEEYRHPEYEYYYDNSDLINDGHDIDEKDKFDRRQSLSYDIQTKFNDNLTAKTTLMSMSKDSYEPSVTWGSSEDIPAYSPQWSPISQSPSLNELASFAPSTDDPTDSTFTSKMTSSKFQLCISKSRTFPNEVVDFDESSLSSDDFDLLQSPALLPLTHTLQDRSDDTELEDHCSTKRNSVGSNLSIEHKKPEPSAGIMTQVIKKAKLNLEDRTSQSSDDGGNEEVKIYDKDTAFCSPSRNIILDEAGVGKCSPNFLKFVKETYSSPSNLMKNKMSTTSILKQPKRKFSSTNKVADTAESTQEEAIAIGSRASVRSPDTPTSVSTEDPVERQPCIESMDDSTSFPVYEEPTPHKVVLGLLCHYCEVSDNYVSSLCQEDSCAQSIATHLQYCNSLDPKIQRILDKLTSCSKCFGHVISSHFAPMLTSACSMRMESISCVQCRVPSHSKAKPHNDWYNSLDNAWHNISLIQSSLYGSHLITCYLNKWTTETMSTTATLLLLTLWYDETGKLCNIAEELRRKLYSNLKVIADRGYLLRLLQCMLDKENIKNSNIFEAICFVFYKLVSRIELSKLKGSDKPRLEGNSTKRSLRSSNRAVCCYEQARRLREPDKELSIYCNNSTIAREEQSPTTKEKSLESADETATIPIHSDVLISESLMFKTMLTSSYKESSEKRIKLMDASYTASVFVVHLLYGCDQTKCNHVKATKKQIEDCTSIPETVITDSSVKQNIELEILKTMDLWIIQEKKDDFISNFMEFFIEKYARPEITRQRLKCRTPNLHQQPGDEAGNTTLSSCFWDYICMHQYHRIVERYVEEFCSPCLFKHDCVKHGEVFVSLCNQFHEGTLFREAIFGKFNQIIDEDLLPKLGSGENK